MGGVNKWAVLGKVNNILQYKKYFHMHKLVNAEPFFL